ncbi:hypothetical protein [Pseudonocardia hydrocarbonoxydans]|uniref:hypothetical protein n=1 Tax=Pseudonocardia hydrocarbonoxydans TaxID=76726 RepID=UPI0031D1B54B
MTAESTPIVAGALTAVIDLAAATQWIGVVLPAAVIAAGVAGTVNIWLARSKARDEERARVRTLLAEAYQAYADYKEFPYAVRRRDAERPGEERVRLSEQMREVQSRLSFFLSWTALESTPVGAAYATMVGRMRAVAGDSIRVAWTSPAITTDADMNLPASIVDLSSLADVEGEFHVAVGAHLRRLTARHMR